MDSFELLYRVAFWMLPAMLLTLLGIAVVTSIIEFFAPVVCRWKRVLICPTTLRDAVVELMRTKRRGLPAKVKVVRCTELGHSPALCGQACLRLKENRPLARPIDLEEVFGKAGGGRTDSKRKSWLGSDHLN